MGLLLGVFAMNLCMLKGEGMHLPMLFLAHRRPHRQHMPMLHPFRLHLFLVTYWKKLTCGVIRSFNCCCCSCSYPCSFFSQSRSGRFFEALGKNIVETDFLRLGSPKPRCLRCILFLVAKTAVFTVFTAPSKKHLHLRCFRHVATSDFSMRKSQNP